MLLQTSTLMLVHCQCKRLIQVVNPPVHALAFPGLAAHLYERSSMRQYAYAG